MNKDTKQVNQKTAQTYKYKDNNIKLNKNNAEIKAKSEKV